MSNEDNPTRILKPQPSGPRADSRSDHTRVIGSGRPGEGGYHQGGAHGDDEPRTRVLSGYSAPEAGGVTDRAEGSAPMTFELAVGWLVVIAGPGRGCTREIYFGMNSVGRGQGERIPLEFGDTAISRESHAYIVFDDKQGDFYIQHGGKSNLVRLNGAPVLAPMPLKRADVIEIGSTKLMFVPLVDESFKWDSVETK